MGREVEVDAADRIATLCATGFDRLLLLGSADPDVEALNALGIDVLYCWQEAIEAGNVCDPAQADFAAICAQLSTGDPTSVDEWRDYLASEVYPYADAQSILEDPTFASTDAVANGAVYLSPAGVMEWDTGSECVLNVLYLAKTLHPELFEDVDLVAEVQECYATFYDTELDAAQAQRILDRLGPDEA
jgi:hypothetical protein